MRKKQNVKHSKRVRNLVAMCLLCGVVLGVSTYAWFIGMKTVKVNKFDINIATTEGLFLSMNGVDWTYKLDVANAQAYENNTNTFAPNGLIPMSSVGDMDKTSSTMKLYEKGSLTAVTGGYRLLASQVDNHTNQNVGNFYTEGKGYVAFDLFIKNLSGEEYYVDNEPKNEEAIYLTTNSSVKVSENGGVNGTGIENSVRVAFAQVGRVKADTEAQDNITGITCSDVPADDGQVQVTGICRSAQIWEPNDTVHTKNALNWYNESCLTRKADPEGTLVNSQSSYNTGVPCDELEPIPETSEYASIPTYAISRSLNVADNVNIYDGPAFNKYTANTIDYATYSKAPEENKTNYKLVDVPYFTDTMKNLEGTQRPTFMTLAPNSITKVRVYVWIEGQDIDNYDFAQLGKEISINFGFTKERYTEDDVNYDGPPTGI